MPGAFAHITLVNIATGTKNLDKFKLNDTTYDTLLEYFEFCELGSVCPDYPYLAIGEDHAIWSDHMHLKLKTKSVIESGIEIVKNIEDRVEKQKVFAWLCGFVAHIVTDVVIHPIVELKVGPYKGNEKAHRLCEMHQDAFIYQRLNLGEIGLAEHLNSGINICSNKGNKDEIDGSVRDSWEKMLRILDPEMFNDNPPEINTWHSRFESIVSAIEEGAKLLPLARHIAVDCALTYPDKDEIDEQYIKSLKIPDDGEMHYDDIFDKAIDEVCNAWKIIGDAVFTDDNAYQAFLGDWNLDNGRDTNDSLVFWA